MSVISVVNLGTVDYAEGLRLQRRLVELRKADAIGDVLLLLEHTPVITLGRNAKSVNVLASEDELAERGVAVYECDRGGDVTFHGPGQVVGYPLFDLRKFSRDENNQLTPNAPESPTTEAESGWKWKRTTLGAVDYVRRLEECLIRTCFEFRIPAKRVKGLTGVWTEKEPEAKIAAIGVHISRAVTSHGFALNVNPDLSYFDLIVPCGIGSKPVTSMQRELGHKVEIVKVMESISRNFSTIFGRQILWVETLDALLGQTVGVPMKPPEELRRMHQEEDSFLV